MEANRDQLQQRAHRYVETSRNDDLRTILRTFNLSTTGNKAALKSRLFELIENLSNEELEDNFPEQYILSDGELEEDPENDTQVGNSDSNENMHVNNTNLDRELENLKNELEKKKQIIELKKQITELEKMVVKTNPKSSTCFNFKDVEESLTQFSGDDDYSIEKWLENFEEAANNFDWDSKTKFVYAKRLMTGTAKLFLRSISISAWSDLKLCLLKEFKRKMSNADIHNKLRHRKKKSDETLQQYVLFMQEIASLGNIDEHDLIQYIINGIQDNHYNKIILYHATNIKELKECLLKYEKLKSNITSTNNHHSNSRGKNIEYIRQKNSNRHTNTMFNINVTCFNCKEKGHISKYCPRSNRDKNSYHRQGQGYSSESEKHVMTISNGKNSCSMSSSISPNEYERYIDYEVYSRNNACKFRLLTLIDSGSPISFIKKCYVPDFVICEEFDQFQKFSGINNSRLQMIGVINCKILYSGDNCFLKIFVVSNNTMKYSCVLGRDFLNKMNLTIDKKVPREYTPTEDDRKQQITDIDFNINEKTHSKHLNTEHININTGMSYNGFHNNLEKDAFNEIFNIEIESCNLKSEYKINENLPYEIKKKVCKILNKSFEQNDVLKKTADVKMHIQLTKSEPFHFAPRRLPFAHVEKLKLIIDDLLKRYVIRESDSPYASPIVLVRKKNDELRLCVDFRELNKLTVRCNYPLPVVEDLLDRLKNKKYFSTLDLKNGFHHVSMAEESIKYTSFVTPFGQYEYVKMPFGLKNAPSTFQKYIHRVFKKLVNEGKILSYMDDLLIASETIGEHLNILEEVIQTAYEYGLEFRADKCQFLLEEIRFLGYIVNVHGLKPNPDSIRAIQDFPVPKNLKELQSFIGLCSYFRKFIESFAIIAKPLYDLLKKNSTFQFGVEELRSFNILREKLTIAPVLSVYDATSETQLHCDASSVGFGAILMQKQKDSKFHPVFFFSKRTTEVESKFHSYELETLSIVYALRRFRIYLTGIKFKIVTDCKALTLTLNKKLLNPRISRWALELQTFDYEIEHRASSRMAHVDALSRCTNILVIEEDSFEFALAVCQHRDSVLRNIAKELEIRESPMYELINGLVYRKLNGKVLFYVPSKMEQIVIQTYHESLCHLGVEKCYEVLKRTYWFPSMKAKIREYIQNCLKCIHFSSNEGKTEGILHSIPKGKWPFETVHIDHYGPLPNSKSKKKHIFVVVDGFTKFTKLYAVASTSTREVIKCLELYFSSYSRPSKIISDRGSCFSSQEFADFIANNNIQLIKIATQTPQSNGQVERINRILTPMLSKSCSENSTSDWSKHLMKVEYALNNTICKSTGFSPSMLLFGVNQRGEHCDKVMEYLQDNVLKPNESELDKIRENASENIRKTQNYNENYFNKKHKSPHRYKPGDLIMIKNVSTLPGVHKKLLSKFRGPYLVKKVLPNDRYFITDVDGVQLNRIPYKGVCAPANMKPYIQEI